MKKFYLFLIVVLVSYNSMIAHSQASEPALATGKCWSDKSTYYSTIYNESNPSAIQNGLQTPDCLAARRGLCDQLNSRLMEELPPPGKTIKPDPSNPICRVLPRNHNFQFYRIYKPEPIVDGVKSYKDLGYNFSVPDLSPPPLSRSYNPIVDPNPTDIQKSVKPTIFFPLMTSPTGPMTVVPIQPDSKIYPFIAEVYRLMNDPKVQQWVKNSITTILIVGGGAAVILAIGGVVTAGATTAASWTPLVAAAAAIILVCDIAGVTVDKNALKMKNESVSAMVTTEQTGAGSYSIIASDNQSGDVKQIDIHQVGKEAITITNGDTCYKAGSKNKNPGGC